METRKHVALFLQVGHLYVSQIEMAKSSQQLVLAPALTRSTAMPSFRRLRSSSLNSVRLRRVFDIFDSDADGEITVAELRLALDRLGLGIDPTDLDELSAMVASYIRPGRAGLDFSDFEAFHRAVGDALFGDCDAGDAEEENDMREAFRVFDENGDGYISATELQAVLQKLGLLEGRSIDGVRQMIAAVDRDRDGRVNFAEFKNMMRSIEVSASWWCLLIYFLVAHEMVMRASLCITEHVECA